MFEDIEMFFEIIFFLLLAIFSIIGGIINKIKQKKEKKQVNFDEFDDIEKIKEQKIKEKQEMENESIVLDRVYENAYVNSITDAMLVVSNSREIDDNDRLKAHFDANKKVQDVEEALYKNKSHNVKEEIITEGSEKVELKENGYNFDVELFKKWSRQIFGCIKMGTEEQLKVVKNFISEELYSKLEKQRKKFANDGLEFITEDLIIEKCTLHDYSRSMSKEEIKIFIIASMKEYIIQKSNNEIIRGDNKKFYTKKIFMTFVKKDIEDVEGLIHNCPNCGAEVTQTEFGKCRYCNTLVVPIRYNWTLTKFETM